MICHSRQWHCLKCERLLLIFTVDALVSCGVTVVLLYTDKKPSVDHSIWNCRCTEGFILE